MTERVVVYGGAGYIGMAIARSLASRGFAVRVADINMPKSDAELEYFKCDVRSYEDVREAAEGCVAAVDTAIIQIPRINEEPRLGYEVNVLGIQNICEAVSRSDCRGVILAGSWHVIGEVGIAGTVDEYFGYRPDKVEERARIYALSKVAQETIVRLYAAMRRDRVFGVVRMGTVLGEGMPAQTAASIFIERALAGEPLTPYRHSMHRPMLYIDVQDVSRAYLSFLERIIDGRAAGEEWWRLVFNLVYPKPMTVLELAEAIRDIVQEESGGRLRPGIHIIDRGVEELYSPSDKEKMRVDVSKAVAYLELGRLTSPQESIRRLIRGRMARG